MIIVSSTYFVLLQSRGLRLEALPENSNRARLTKIEQGSDTTLLLKSVYKSRTTVSFLGEYTRIRGTAPAKKMEQLMLQSLMVCIWRDLT